MPGIHHQSGQRHGDQGCPGGQKGHGHILHGTCVNSQAHNKGPEKSVACILQENAKADTQDHITCHHRQGLCKCFADRPFHSVTPSRAVISCCLVFHPSQGLYHAKSQNDRGFFVLCHFCLSVGRKCRFQNRAKGLSVYFPTVPQSLFRAFKVNGLIFHVAPRLVIFFQSLSTGCPGS